jgi:hypothetical protein
MDWFDRYRSIPSSRTTIGSATSLLIAKTTLKSSFPLLRMPTAPSASAYGMIDAGSMSRLLPLTISAFSSSTQKTSMLSLNYRLCRT